MDKNSLLQLVKSSPEIVARRDREAWLDLFTSTAVVEDPVGAGPNRKGADVKKGKDGLGRFYDVFIAPNTINFTVITDIVAGSEVVRHVRINTTLPNGAVSDVDAHLIYRCEEEEGRPKIAELRAFWDFTGNAKALLGNNGFRGISASMAQFGRMLRIQGIRRVLVYCAAMYRGIFSRGIKIVRALADSVNTGDSAGFIRLFDPFAEIEVPAGSAMPASEFMKTAEGLGTMALSAIRSAGWHVSCGFDAEIGGVKRSGVAFFRFNPATKRIAQARFFWDE